ncbi:unnamed protein product [Polarella glacialis]|uniref:protein-tyrosine-phosphatase n=2 Tax=Polarella glacialis TaxID=89957 RepID=A0A813JZZ4_POLGL|nr:unnamed protein product [Polarella glacialis]|mmetsp:Transcript_64915/g.104878  ORF Transcript_64915/g.104878 Transcript_64915/m.104878 type:complete len:477 (-) Transcript_64915:23-1453(-)|eukprot:CAMPEP_0115102590 /NCGR_PEP_ID=MMETSP0227-20121206/34000_1 /TAXON_ID=89957 /ORGANISM="Polarella glacialis, Strain CCMP 1383" /LENGTH=476 /DNA_ID=CAMNT_0002498725 /DNA_START=114 /DNA_END=1544 /DNA_ORIENTATION=+
MSDRELAEAIELIPDRLYWVALHTVPKTSLKSHFFSIDHDLIYEPFFADFGPLNLSMVYRYCKMLEAKLADAALADRRIVHYCSHDPKKRANAATLICAFQVIVLGKSADMAYSAFNNIYPPFLPYRDATCGICTYGLTVLDCMKGLEKSIEVGWFDWNKFDVESYEFFEKVENGDMNWIIPDKFLAFAGPCPTPTDADGFPAFTPEDYVPIFREAGIGLVVRLNKKQYDRRRFLDHGLKHVDLYFLDGSCPDREIISKFLHIVESEPSAIAVHCKAGLGRTGTLIGLYAMKHLGWNARAYIGWNRICRPGSILGPQQQFLCDMQNDMHQAGAALRRPQAPPSDPREQALAQQVERMSLRERTQAEQIEDTGQGDRLVGAKRVIRPGPGSPTNGGSPTGSLMGHGSPLLANLALPPVGRGVGVGSNPGSPMNGGSPHSMSSAPVTPLSPSHRSGPQDPQRPVVSMLRKSLKGIFSH